MSELTEKSNINKSEIDAPEINATEIKVPLLEETKDDTPDGSIKSESKEKLQESKDDKTMKKKKKKEDKIFLELGQFIEIESPGNDDLNEKSFYIEYLDENSITLIDDFDKTVRELTLNNGKITDESIKAINILYFPDEKGYARQNGLVMDSWWTIEFGGNVPTIINGQITNLENDMIELSMYPSKEKIYIDFEYKGIPKKYNIVELRPFSEPLLKVSLEDIPEESEESSKVQLSDAMKELKRSQSEQSSIEVEIDDDEYDDIVFNFEEDEKKEELEKILLDANSIILIEDELVEDIVEVVEVDADKRKYPINFQINDLLDSLLSQYPTSERNSKILNNIHIIIERFKDLRMNFSDFSRDGVINKFKKITDNKPLLNHLSNMDVELDWLIPIVKNKKRLYDLNVIEDAINEDVNINETMRFINNYGSVLHSYKNNAVPDDSQKYAYLQQQIHSLQLTSDPPTNRINVINKVKINSNIHAIIDNLDEYNSSVANVKDEETTVIGEKKYAIQKYITGEFSLYQDPLLKKKSYTKMPTVQNESIYLKGFIMLPKYYTELSKLKLHQSSIYKKILLHNNLRNISSALNKSELLKYNIDEDFEDLSYKTSFLKFPSEISFIERLSYSERNNDEVYKKFLDKMIPSIEKIIQNLRGYLKTETNFDAFLRELEPFMIYDNTLSVAQYNLINTLINENIVRFKKTLSGRLLELNKNIETTRVKPNFIDVLFSSSDVLEQEDMEVAKKAENKAPGGAAKDGEAKDGEAKERDPMERKVSNLNEFIKNVYMFEGRKINNSDMIREMNHLDGGNLLNTVIGLLQIDMRESMNLQNKLEKEIEYADEKIRKGANDNPENPCRNFVLTKTYTDIDTLQADNNVEFVFYDKKNDNTPYDILSEFLKEKRDMSDEEFKNFLVDHLVSNVGVKPADAERDSESMIIGQKRVIDGEYAVLDLGDYEYRYYERINNQWRLQDEFNDKMPDDSMFCNIKDKCLKINDSCAEEDQNKIKIHNMLVNEIIENFSKELEKSFKDLKRELKSKQKKQTITLTEKIRYKVRDFLKKNNRMVALSREIDQEELKISPYSKILYRILEQKDMVKKNNDIILFYNKYCRPYEITNANENLYWSYCLDTGFPLMPTFLYELAEAYKTDRYQEKLVHVSKERGVLSNDGDKLVDKYSGFVIKYIELDTDEGYNAEGYKNKSRDLLKDDDGDLIIETMKIKEYMYKTKLARVIYRILESTDKNIGFNMIMYYDFIVENTVKILKKLISEDEYNRKIEIAKTKGKKLKPYKSIVDEKIINSIMALYIICVQSAIPPIQTSKTFPGCRRDFSGFPLTEGSSNNGFIEYILCVFLKIKNDSRPWTGLPRINRKSQKNVERINRYIIRFKSFIVDEVISIKEINEKLKVKREWLKVNIDQVKIAEEFNIKRWTTFLPPLNRVKLNKVKMFGNSIKQKLLATITKDKNEQFIILNKLFGKTKLLSIYIITKINAIIRNKEKLFVTNSGMPYLQNACCHDKQINTYDYFVEEDPTIQRDVGFVSSLMEIISNVSKLNKAPYLISEKNTKTPVGRISESYTEETIYKAFIKYCKYNTGLTIHPELEALCIKNESAFKDIDTIEEKIEIIKNENGNIYNEKSLQLLMKHVAREKSVSINLDRTFKVNKIVFEELLKYISQKENVRICNKELIPKLLDITQKYSVRYIPRKDVEDKEDFLLFLDEEVINLRNNVDKYLRKNLSRHYRKISKYLKTFTNYDLKGDNNYMTKFDETNHFIGSEIRKMILEMCLIYPNIILEKVSYDMYVPEHWNLSARHENDVKKIIHDEHILLNEYYNNTEIVKLLNLVKENTIDLISIVENIPFYSQIVGSEKETIFDSRVYVKLHQYFFMCTLNLYISLFNEMKDNSVLGSIAEQKKMVDKSIEDTIIKGFQDNLEKTLANLLKTYMIIFVKRKKLINLTNTKIESNILKAKEQEKDSIRQNLKNLTNEQRKIENIMKNHKLGRWSFGESRAVFEYDAEQYDKERKEIEDRYLIERRSGAITDTTKSNMELYQMEGENLDYLEKQFIDDRISTEVNYIDAREDGEADGEEEW